jgi:ketosteroid isomerase-like protein
VVLRFIALINAHDVRGMCALMSEDHLFVDSLGDSLRGRDEMFRAWTSYFFLFPDFTITQSHLFCSGNEVALFGTARGSALRADVPSQREGWMIPAAWRAVVREGRVAEWHIYADNEPVRRLLAAGA